MCYCGLVVAADLELLDRWCAGDKQAGNDLFQRYFNSIYQFFESKVTGDVDELVQRTFLACVKSRDAFRRQCTFRTYLFTLARNELYRYLRGRHRTDLAVDFGVTSLADIQTTPATRVARSRDHKRLLRALRTLPLDLQLLLELHYWEGMASAELASVFDIAQTTARTRLFRARSALRERMQVLANEPRLTSMTVEDLDEWARSLCIQLSAQRNLGQ